MNALIDWLNDLQEIKTEVDTATNQVRAVQLLPVGPLGRQHGVLEIHVLHDFDLPFLWLVHHGVQDDELEEMMMMVIYQVESKRHDYAPIH